MASKYYYKGKKQKPSPSAKAKKERKLTEEQLAQLLVGTLSKHRKGYGFVIPDDKEETNGEDVFIPPQYLGTAMHGDKVGVRVSPLREQGKGIEGRVEAVLKRETQEVAGYFEKKKGYGYVTPEDRKLNSDILILKQDFNGAKNGDTVVAKITTWPEPGRLAEGRVVEILAKRGEVGGDIKALIRQAKIIENFPHKVEDEAALAPDSIEEKDMAGRVDLREKNIITIDGADAKDLDDGVSVEILENGNYLLGVHIADVSHYVKEGRPLDKEALKRGTSIYLIDQVIPMLPRALSNGICSLNPHVDRLTLSIDMEINDKGKVVNHRIYKSIINSRERMVYGDVSDMLENDDKALQKKYEHIWQDIVNMDRLAKILRKTREGRGSLDFDFDEAYITLNEEGIPVNIGIAERRTANKIIEEFMLAANEAVAEHFFWLSIPFVYRVHEKPASEKMTALASFVRSFGIILKGSPDNIHPRALNEILEKIQGKPEENIISTVMLRSMKKAFYDTECQGHFGLGVKYYCHFTSPIRRYPDLMIHRIIKETLDGKALGESRMAALKKKTEEAAMSSSTAERKAEELEREVEKMKKAEYMCEHIGEEFEGIISGAASFGFFVQLPNTIEGMVKVDGLKDDYYEYQQDKYRLVGKRHRKIYALGDRVKIRVESVDLPNREINFALASSPSIKESGKQEPEQEVLSEGQ